MVNRYFILLLFFTLVGCTGEEKVEKHNQDFQLLWNDTIYTALDEALWLNDYAYDASASLMLPMHYAYEYPYRFDIDPRDKFYEFIENSYLYTEFSSFEGNVTKYQFLYFITQNLKLEQARGNLNEDILTWASKHIIDSWQNESFSIWTDISFYGVKERIEWNLSNPETNYSFHRAVIDKEWFTLAAINDLAVIYNNANKSIPFDNEEVKLLSRQLIDSFGTYEGDSWFFQRGVWHDHRDYRYAGNASITADINISEIESIGIDSNHLHRLPLWLMSFSDNNFDEKEFFMHVKNAHKNTYEALVLTHTEIVGNFTLLQNNYSTGENGVYRYNYVTQGEGSGYDAFELSGTLFIGYYAFLDSEKYKDGMSKMVKQFPLNSEILNFYVGPNTSRTRHHLFSWPAYFENGFAEMFSRVVACYNERLSDCE